MISKEPVHDAIGDGNGFSDQIMREGNYRKRSLNVPPRRWTT